RFGRFGRRRAGCVRSRMISFARQGYVAFNWSMVGYNEAKQIGHRKSFQDIPWGFSVMGLQLWNSIRACDFLTSLKDVDHERIGCTGGSGGGTQTFILMAVDDRITAAAPVNMISASMQGGCECENSPLLRLEANNVEFTSMMAPRPLLMVSVTGDWTKNTLELEYPAVQAVYKLYDAEDKVKAVRFNARHNYNMTSRNVVYPFFARWLLGASDPDSYQEKPLTVNKEEDLLVFTKENPRPAYALDKEGLRSYMIDEARRQLRSLRPKDKKSLEKFREVFRPAYKHTFNAVKPSHFESVSVDVVYKDFTITKSTVSTKGTGWQIPVIIYRPGKSSLNSPVTIIVHPDGCSGLGDLSDDKPELHPLVKHLLAEGHIVVGLDVFLTGEYLAGGKTRRPKAPTHDLTYNRTDLAWRVQDIVTVVAFSGSIGAPINLAGLERAGLWTLSASPLVEVHKTVIDAAQFDHERNENWQGEMLVPGIRRIGGLQSAAALTAPDALLIHNAGDSFKTDWIMDAYRATGVIKNLRIEKNKLSYEKIAKYLSK
ncbi:MAG: hypothetical protein KAT56_08275, partial [Sedimentisphaerales bacterium]|nr:hypothetical protein [Sedimentisphaerales bacterium]